MADRLNSGEAFWHAVVSESCPVINKAIRREDVAEEYASKCRDEGYRDIEVVPLYRATPSALPAQAVGVVTDAMRKAFDDRNNSLEADERDGIIAAILALAAPMPQPEPTSKGEEEVVIVRSGNFPPGWDK